MIYTFFGTDLQCLLTFFHFRCNYVKILVVSSRRERWSSTTSYLKRLQALAGMQRPCTTSPKRTGWTSQGRTWPSVSAHPALRLYWCTSAPRQRTILLSFWGRMVKPTHAHTHLWSLSAKVLKGFLCSLGSSVIFRNRPKWTPTKEATKWSALILNI